MQPQARGWPAAKVRCFPDAGFQVRSLVRELDPRMPQLTAGAADTQVN